MTHNALQLPGLWGHAYGLLSRPHGSFATPK